MLSGLIMASQLHSWEMPIETGEIPVDGSEFDAIVVGGGPGGSSAAGYLAKGGKRVLLIEKEFGQETRFVVMLLVVNH